MKALSLSGLLPLNKSGSFTPLVLFYTRGVACWARAVNKACISKFPKLRGVFGTELVTGSGASMGVGLFSLIGVSSIMFSSPNWGVLWRRSCVAVRKCSTRVVVSSLGRVPSQRKCRSRWGSEFGEVDIDWSSGMGVKCSDNQLCSTIRCHSPGALEKGILEQGELYCTQFVKTLNLTVEYVFQLEAYI